MKFSLLSLVAALAATATAVSIQQEPMPFELMEAKPMGGAPTKPVPGKSPMLVCDLDVSQLLDITYLKINPNPPQKGADLFIEAEGILKDTIGEGAFVEVEVRYGFIRLVKETIDLCEQVEKADKSCPLDRGVIKFSKSVELPGEIPQGKYNVVARAYKEDYTEITCLTAQVEFARS
ncbi:Phosphatidylglycerol/phosphatidylinositol transfer protein [Myxozyma melibiosi]|uniref:Phosphatidylglycerol/phosphatidylinositol transfer protein n=1 Tax=Myxozyma melibiosi TaxID=54550 RepID=A0ABR1F8I4_9ASCO